MLWTDKLSCSCFSCCHTSLCAWCHSHLSIYWLPFAYRIRSRLLSFMFKTWPMVESEWMERKDEGEPGLMRNCRGLRYSSASSHRSPSHLKSIGLEYLCSCSTVPVLLILSPRSQHSPDSLRGLGSFRFYYLLVMDSEDFPLHSFWLFCTTHKGSSSEEFSPVSPNINKKDCLKCWFSSSSSAWLVSLFVLFQEGPLRPVLEYIDLVSSDDDEPSTSQREVSTFNLRFFAFHSSETSSKGSHQVNV